MTDDITMVEQQLRQMFGAPLTTSERELLDDRVRQRLASAKRSPRSMWRRPGRVTLIAAVLALVIPLAALGGIFSTEDPYGLADPAEFQAELDAALADVALPPGRAWPDVPSLHAEQPGVGAYSRGGARSTVELIAFCIWLDDWADARGAGDATSDHNRRHAPGWRAHLAVVEQPVLDGVRSGPHVRRACRGGPERHRARATRAGNQLQRRYGLTIDAFLTGS